MTDRSTEAGTDLLFRDATIELDRDGSGADQRLASLSFSSETQVHRWFGGEVLDHSPGSVRMGFLASGRAPLLVNHDRSSLPVGVVTSAAIGADRKGRAVVKFGRDPESDRVLQSVRDGILTNVSVGYRVHDMKLESSGDDGDVYRVTDWEPLEVSLVSIPADHSVGVGRSNPEFQHMLTRARSAAGAESTSMTEATTPTRVELAGKSAEIAQAERNRIQEIRALGARHSMTPLAERHIEDGTSIELFRGLVLAALEERGSSAPIKLGPGPTEIGLSARELGRFSLSRWIVAQADRNESPIEKGAPFELEACLAATQAATRAGVKIRGYCLPGEISERIVRLDATRTLTSSGGVGTGGALVQSTVLAAAYVPPNYNVPIVTKAGARVLSGLIGNVLIPAMTAGKAGTWVSPENTAVSSADPTFAQIPLSPKDVGSVCDISRRLLIQSNPAVDGLVRDDIAVAISEAIDQGAINGSGSSGQPTGLLNNGNIGVQATGTNGGAITWANVTYLPQLVGTANRLLPGAPMGWVANWQAFAHCLRTPKVPNYPVFIAEYADNSRPTIGAAGGSMLGYPVHISQNVPGNLTKGTGTNLSALFFANWSDLIIGEWGVLDMLVDPYTFSNTGAIRVRAFQTVDINVRYPGAFAVIKDLVTT